MTDFVIYLWGVPEVEDSEQKARALAEAGFTIVDGFDETHEPVVLDVDGIEIPIPRVEGANRVQPLKLDEPRAADRSTSYRR